MSVMNDEHFCIPCMLDAHHKCERPQQLFNAGRAEQAFGTKFPGLNEWIVACCCEPSTLERAA